MKNILLAACCIIQTSAFAQNGQFWQPQVGVGICSMHGNHFPYDYSGTKIALAYNIRMCIGNDKNDWIYSAGLGYMRSGYKQRINYTSSGMPLLDADLCTYFNHIMIPLNIGRRVTRKRKYDIIVVAGADVTYNYSAMIVSDFPGSPNSQRMSSENFQNTYRPFSIFGNLRAELDYKISPRLSISCAPTFEYMLTNMLKATGTTQHNYTLMLNAGVRWNRFASHHNNDPHIGGKLPGSK